VQPIRQARTAIHRETAVATADLKVRSGEGIIQSVYLAIRKDNLFCESRVVERTVRIGAAGSQGETRCGAYPSNRHCRFQARKRGSLLSAHHSPITHHPSIAASRSFALFFPRLDVHCRPSAHRRWPLKQSGATCIRRRRTRAVCSTRRRIRGRRSNCLGRRRCRRRFCRAVGRDSGYKAAGWPSIWADAIIPGRMWTCASFRRTRWSGTRWRRLAARRRASRARGRIGREPQFNSSR
jgi:hypothetical protein